MTRRPRFFVVTGATAGIGRAYSHELAKRGLNVVLISRSLEKLSKVAAEIEKQYNKRTKIIQADFTQGLQIYGPIRASLQDLDIGILVNNVGMMLMKKPGFFLEVPDLDHGLSDIINCNILSMTQMTQMVLPQMVKRRAGVIINISSEAGNSPQPLLTVYAATKAFMDFFSRGLEVEYRSRGILIQCVMPLGVKTDMNFYVHPNKILEKTPEDFAQEALNTVGISNRTSGCLSHAIQSFLIALWFPEWFRFSAAGWKMTQWLTNRQKEE